MNPIRRSSPFPPSLSSFIPPSSLQEVKASGESLAQEKSSLLAKKEASEQRIRELENDIKILTQRAVERETELERSVWSI